jgi:hypothetical protein
MAYYLLRSDGSVHSTIEFRSADNPDSLRGEGVDAAVVDEAGYWNRESFISVQTTLTQRMGKLRIISTPKGRNWFFDEWYKGWRGHPDNPFKANPKPEADYASYSLPTPCNPTVKAESIDYAKRNMPADSFRQEYLAEFLSESAGVFQLRGVRDLTALLEADVRPPLRDGSGLGEARRLHGLHDRRRRDPRSGAHRAAHRPRLEQQHRPGDSVAKAWNNAAVLMDSTGVGDVPFDHDARVYANTSGYSISTNAAKKALIQKLQFAFERAQIGIPDKSRAPRSARSASASRRRTDQRVADLLLPRPRTASCSTRRPTATTTTWSSRLALLNWQFAEEPFVYKYRKWAGV